jgi:predicted RNA-binding protein YlxR (DUF448 family)
VRLVRGSDGLVAVDARGEAPGRGAYVCVGPDCLTAGLRRERLAHAFRKPCRVPPDLGAVVEAVVRARDAMARAPVK